MPRFTLDISEPALAGLQALVARYNADNGVALSVQDWLLLHLKELAVQDQLLESARTLREQADRDADAAFKAERQRLLDSVA
jgi:hypothetical protein